MARTKLYDPQSSEPFKISRSKIESFMRCPRCFVLNVKHGVKDISSAPFTLNVAVDAQLKKEFDIHRANQTLPELIAAAGLDLVPFQHELMDQWRENFKGVQTTTDDFFIYGAVDDIWVNRDGELVVVDYKATGKREAMVELPTGGFYDGYRRQMEIYQWLLRRNGFKVSNTGYWLYATATQKQDTFDAALHFELALISYEGDDSWIEGVLADMKQTLDDDELPFSGEDCDVCRYVKQRKLISPHDISQP
jgi:PD-(D/E)XK nuclease superfamily